MLKQTVDEVAYSLNDYTICIVHHVTFVYKIFIKYQIIRHSVNRILLVLFLDYIIENVIHIYVVPTLLIS